MFSDYYIGRRGYRGSRKQLDKVAEKSPQQQL
jgi:hypothetical protein